MCGSPGGGGGGVGGGARVPCAPMLDPPMSIVHANSFKCVLAVYA